MPWRAMEKARRRPASRTASVFDWTDLAYQQKLAGNTGLLVFWALRLSLSF